MLDWEAVDGGGEGEQRIGQASTEGHGSMHGDARQCKGYASNVSGDGGSNCNMAGHFCVCAHRLTGVVEKGRGGKREGVPGGPRAETAGHSGRRGRWPLPMVRPKRGRSYLARPVRRCDCSPAADGAP